MIIYCTILFAYDYSDRFFILFKIIEYFKKVSFYKS